MKSTIYTDRQRPFCFCGVVVVLLLFSFPTSEAAWPDDPAVNLPVCAMNQMQASPDATSDGSGGIIIVWQDSRNLGNDIYARRIGADGSYLWAAPICMAAGEQERPKIVPDGLGGAIIVWEDRRSTTPDLYAQRVDANGFPQWTANGIIVSEGPSYENQLQLIPDGFGGAVASWTDGRNGLPDIYTQRISAAGDTLWTLDGVKVCPGAQDKVESELTADGSGGAIIAWVDGRDLRNRLYAQRIDAGGTTSWQIDGVAVTDTVVSQDEQRLVGNGAGGAIITWADQRGGAIFVYSQFMHGGARMWAPNGVPICSIPEGADTPRPVSDGEGGVIVAWYDYRSGNADIYAQRINGGGFIQWPENGVAVCTDESEQIWPRVASDGMGGAIVSWQDYRNPATRPDIYARRIDRTGTTYWTPDGVAITTAADSQEEELLVPDGQGGAILSWRDRRDDIGDIYAQQVGSNGQLGNLVPVLINDFRARPTTIGVELAWNVFHDETIEGYRIYRQRTGERDVLSVSTGLVPATERRYVDRSVNVGGEYLYTLAVVLHDGSETRSSTVAVKMPVGEISLGQNVPNPFNPTTTISFVLPKSGRATLAVYDAKGRLVRMLTDGSFPRGRNEVYWNGRDASDSPVSSGVYFCRLSFGKATLTRKMVLIR